MTRLINVTSPPAYGYSIYHNGLMYFWDGAGWRDVRGARVAIDVQFNVLGPIALLPLYTPSAVAGKPSRLWSRPAHSNGIASSIMTDQMRNVRVGVFLGNQQTVRVPIVDAAGVPLLGPEIPPMMILREAETSADVIGSYDTGGYWYADAGDGMKLVPDVTEGGAGVEVQIAAALELEGTPNPHWVLEVAKKTVNDPSTLLVDLVGQSSGLHDPSFVEVGTSGVSGHWRVELLHAQQDFLSVGDLAAFNERVLYRRTVQVPASSFVDAYVTTTGLVGGSNIFSTLPAVFVTGHSDGTNVSASTDSAFEPESFGRGTLYATPVHEPLSANKRYHTKFRLESGTSKHQVRVYNLGSAARTFFVHAWGKGTISAATFWTADAGTMDASLSQARKFYFAQGDLPPTGITINWSTFGDENSGNLFGNAKFPLVLVQTQGAGSASRFGLTGHFGPIFAPNAQMDRDQYFWRSSWNGAASIHQTRILLRGDGALGNSQTSGRKFYAYAMGE